MKFNNDDPKKNLIKNFQIRLICQLLKLYLFILENNFYQMQFDKYKRLKLNLQV
jgi:hypothetical protein